MRKYTHRKSQLTVCFPHLSFQGGKAEEGKAQAGEESKPAETSEPAAAAAAAASPAKQEAGEESNAAAQEATSQEDKPAQVHSPLSQKCDMILVVVVYLNSIVNGWYSRRVS